MPRSSSQTPSEAEAGGGPFSHQSGSSRTDRHYQPPQKHKRKQYKPHSYSAESNRHHKAKRHFAPQPPFQPGFGACPPPVGACPPPVPCPPVPCPPPQCGPIGAPPQCAPPCPPPCPPNVYPMQRGEIKLCADLCAFVSVISPELGIPPPPRLGGDCTEVVPCVPYPQGYGKAGFTVVINYDLQTARVEFNVFTTKLSSCVIGIDIVLGSGCKGVLGQPLFDLGRIYRRARAYPNLNGNVEGSFDVTLPELKHMLMGQWFLRVSSEQYPLGELGGYIRPAP